MPIVAGQDNYNFGSETVNKGYSADSVNRDAEDTTYQTLTEADQYPNTNFSGSSENIVTGTAGGAAFPSALTTDDASRRNYIEANTGGGSPTYQVLRPTSDGSVTTMIEYPASPTTHYDKVDETTTGGDNDATYLEGVTNAQESELGMSDPSDPGGSPDIDVTMWHISKGETTSSCTVVWGIEIGGVEYQGGSTSMTSITYANFSYEWTTNPAGGEWTLSAINGLETYVRVTDANPDTHTTQVGLLIEFNPSASYQVDVQITYSSVTSTAQTISFNVLCQGYRNGDSEDINVQAWNYITSGWDLKATISAGSDTDYNFDLTSQQRDSGANEVKLRLVDASNGDATQTTTYLDVLKVNRIERGYALDVEMTASSCPSHGDLQLRVKGYTSTETFNIQMYNWGGSIWSGTVTSVTALSNTWVNYDFAEATYLSGTYQVKIRFLDGTDQASDTTEDVLYLDVAWVSHYHVDPSMSQDGCDPVLAEIGTTIHFFVIVTDADNELPSSGYPKVDIESTTYVMTENSSGDVDTYDGKAYYFDKSDFGVGVYDFHFITKDVNSGEITTSNKQFEIEAPSNNPPALSDFQRSPDDPVYITTELTFLVNYSDAENEPPTYIKWREDGGATQNVSMTESDPEDDDVTDGKMYEILLYLGHGSHNYDFATSDGTTYVSGGSNSITVQNRAPEITNGPTAPHEWRNTYWEYDFAGHDDDDDSISWEKAGPAWLSINSGTGLLYGTTTNTPSSYVFTVYLNDSYSGSDSFEFTLYIDNRAPEILSSGNTTQMQGTYMSYHVIANDPDGDGLSIEYATNASFLVLDGWYVNGTCTEVGIFWNKIWVNDSYGGSDLEEWDLFDEENQAPYFTSTPDNETTNNTEYEYLPVVVDPDYGPSPLFYSLATNATFLQINSTTGRLNGTPNQIGSFWVNITVSDGDKYIFQNWTLIVMPEISSEVITLAMGLIFCFAFLFIGLKQPHFMVLGGIIWIVVSLTIFISYGEVFMMIGLATGLGSLFMGASRLW